MQKLITPMLAVKFLYLRNLQITLGDGDIRRGFSYDYFSIVYFLDACPVLENFVLCVSNFFLQLAKTLSCICLRTVKPLTPDVPMFAGITDSRKKEFDFC
jgi:hypothetical protein